MDSNRTIETTTTTPPPSGTQAECLPTTTGISSRSDWPATRLAGVRPIWALVGLMLVLGCLCSVQLVAAGGKGGKGGEEDIILYNGNIVMRGDKQGGSIVMANNHPHHEEVEFSPSFFSAGHGFGEMGHHGYRRRR